MNYRIKILLLLIIVAAVLCGCEWLAAVQGAAETPEGQAAIGGVVNNAIKGNWLGAVYNLIEFGVISAGTYKATMIARDGRRKKRGEPTGKASPMQTESA